MTASPPPRPPAEAIKACAASSIQSNESVSGDKQTTLNDKQGLNAAPAPSAQHGNSADSLSATPTTIEGGFDQLATPEVSRRSSRSSSRSSILSTLSDEDGDYSPGHSAEENEDDEEQEQNTRKACRPSLPNVATRTPASSSPVTYGECGSAWGKDEDRLLVRLVRRHGREWQEILENFNRNSSTQRSLKALQSRWARNNPRSAVTEAATSSGAPTSWGSMRGGPRSQLWTKEEVDVLRQSLARLGSKAKSSRKVVFKDYLDAFPTSSRSYSAVDHKVLEVLRAEGTHEENDRDQQDEAASSGEEETPSETSPSSRQNNTTSRTRHRSDQQNQLPPKRVRATTSKYPSANSFAGWQTGKSIADSAPLRHSQPLNGASASDSAPDVDVGVIYADGGLIIEDCPKLYEVRVFSPTYVKITRQRSQHYNTSSGLQNPAFHFQVLHDNSIDAVAIPPGTTANMAAVPADGRGAAASVGGTVLERRWSGPDGYFVTFRSAL